MVSVGSAAVVSRSTGIAIVMLIEGNRVVGHVDVGFSVHDGNVL